MAARRARLATAVLGVTLLPACSLLPAPEPPPEAADHFTDADAVALAEAVAAGDADEVRRLVAEGADPDAKGLDERTVLQWAILTESDDGLVALLDVGADPNLNGVSGKTPLEDTVDVDTPTAVGERMIPLLLAGGADPSAQNAITGEAPLSVACVTSSALAMQLLIDGGADVDGADRNGGRALHACARVNRGAQLLVLLEAGADPEATTSSGSSFQDYYFGYDREILNERALGEREAVIAWLEEHGYEVIPKAYG
ncbi:hypothetical protein GCM10028820_08290 [Tessaracoccus terricola]